MLKIVFLFLCLLSISCYAYIDPALDAERRAFLPSFLYKITGTQDLALNNLTVHATEDYCWNNQYSGSFCGAAAQDYVIILFTLVPYYNSTTGVTTYLPLDLIGITILSVDLVSDGQTNDIYSIKYILNNTQLNGETFLYDIQDGLFYTTYYVFQKGSALVSSETVTSADGAKFISASSSVADISQLCLIVVNYACLPGTENQQYATYDECIDKMTLIDQQNAARIGGGCPDKQVSNTTICRLLHAATALTYPPTSNVLHCPHTGTPSTICIDLCWDVCDHCDPNAQCQYKVNQYGERSYECICNDGYIGNGTSCARTNCSAQYECAGSSNYNYVGCNTTTSQCYCQATFTWNPLTGGCDCTSGNSVWYSNSAFCLPTGRCRDKYQCTTNGTDSAGQSQPAVGNWNQVNCVPYGTLTTLFPDNSCLCNYGYDGGFFVPCTCAAGRTEVWSPTVNGNVCLTSSQCIADYSCPTGKHCNFSVGPSSGVGVCA
eukprot:TRINITY_DN273_c0_g1_i1.p1 TRINITY_DN273_c0_g1~~TRINITY_DN273_c0_g1_i1.p1  ORF type:complete len:490 (-),score=89.88 TRINITY_DN273_c0_g1_i1:50-1519(-)